MSRNAGQRFLQGFQPNFANMFDMGFKTDQIVKERQRQEQEKLKAQQEQQGILEQLTNGKLQGGSYRGKFAPLDMSLNLQDQTNLISRADDNTLQRYKLISEMNKPQSDEYLAPVLDKDLKTIHRYNKTKGVFEDTQQLNPLYKEDVPTSFEVVKANTIKGYENYPDDYTVQLTKKGDEITGQTQPHTMRQQSINISTGQEYNKLDTDTEKLLNNWTTELNGLRALLTHAPDDNGKYRIYDKLGQDTGIRYTPEQVQKAINDKNAELENFLNVNGGVAISDYRGYKSRAETDPKIQGKKNSQQASLWNNIYQDYIKSLDDEKDDAWLMTQKYAFIKDYGVDPIMKFHQGLYKRKK